MGYRVAHRAEHAALRLLAAALRSLPEGAVGPAAALLGDLWFILDRRHRRLARANIVLSLGSLPEVDPAGLARRNFRHLVLNLAEFARLPVLGPARLGEMVSFQGLGLLEEALAAGRGAVLLTAHLGNWELMAAAYAALGRDITVLARRMRNPLSERLVRAARERAGVKVASGRGALAVALGALRRGGAVGVLMDQSAQRWEGLRTDFLGRPAFTHYGPALLARRAGAPVIPVHTFREAGGRHRVVVGPPLRPAAGPLREAVLEDTRRFTKAVESMVCSHPEQWFWVHDRWKERG